MKSIYFFGDGKADGSAKEKKLLGGKGANLAEMTNLGMPVPPGFTINTKVCTHYMQTNTYPKNLDKELSVNMKKIENIIDQKFGDSINPLLVSIRSGARESMPGMMETILNVGLTSDTIPGLIKKSGDERFVYDAYRRLLTMYADVVMAKDIKIELEPADNIRLKLDRLVETMKDRYGLKSDADLSVSHLKDLCQSFKSTIKELTGEVFPDDPYQQLWNGITAVFKSWDGSRALNYRKIENIPNDWGTAVNIQAMVFGNMGLDCATGVAFTRNPSTGENKFYGEWLPNAQGEDVVAGLRTPNPINLVGKNEKSSLLPSLQYSMPKIYVKLNSIRKQLEAHYKDMQDIEFTIQTNKLWMLQTRTGKRTGTAAIRIAIKMVEEGLIDEKTALLRVKPEQLNEIMHPKIDSKFEKKVPILTSGLPAGPGGASGQIVFTADDAEAWNNNGKHVILVRNKTSPEDIHGMYTADAILTASGGVTSHAALVARGWGKCCVVGCSELKISASKKILMVNEIKLIEGDWITVNGNNGNIYEGKIPLTNVNIKSNNNFIKFMRLAEKYRKLDVRTNADSPKDVIKAREFGAKGIGLCRTEHMFFDPDRIVVMRQMIIANNNQERRTAIMKLLPYQREDFYNILKVMAPYPVTIRLLDPPLHEFLPQEEEQKNILAKELNISSDELKKRIDNLYELNPMLGHRGCRLGISYPEITEMQTRAVFEATVQLVKEKLSPFPEIMIPLVGSVSEFIHQKKIVDSVAKDVCNKTNIQFEYLVGTMIELPRACITADLIAKEAQFFSFGTNDLTQTSYGFSRDDIGGFLPNYLNNNILSHDPFQSIDEHGVGELVNIGVEKGRSVNSKLKIGICGEHGGDPQSIHFFHKIGLNYVSCSPFRVPIALLAAAQAEIISDKLLGKI